MDHTLRFECAGKEHYVRHLEAAPESVRLVSAADKLANVRSMLQNYRAVGELLWDRVSAPKNDQSHSEGFL